LSSQRFSSQSLHFNVQSKSAFSTVQNLGQLSWQERLLERRQNTMLVTLNDPVQIHHFLVGQCRGQSF